MIQNPTSKHCQAKLSDLTLQRMRSFSCYQSIHKSVSAVFKCLFFIGLFAAAGSTLGQTVTAVSSSGDDGTNVDDNTLDQNLGTRWSADGNGQWVKYELDTIYHISDIDIAFYNGDQRIAYFDIETSVDDTSWTSVYNGQSSGSSLNLQNFDVVDTNAKYIRYVGHGNSLNTWNSVTEVEISGTAPVPVVVDLSSSGDDGTNVDDNTLDQNLGTRWSADGSGQWVKYELDAVYYVDEIDIAFFNGDQRITYFDIDTSLDNTNWVTVYSGQSSGSTLSSENFALAGTNAKYIRYVGFGNSSNTWNSVTEVEISGQFPVPTVTAVSSSSDDGTNIDVNTLDEDLGTRWSADGNGEWIKFELDGIYLMSEIDIAFYNGDQRVTYFDIETSVDDTSWTTVYSGQSSGSTLSLETFDLTDGSAKYIRYVGYGNSSNSWNSVTEVDLPSDLPPPVQTTTSITQFGITWTFDRALPYGQFANGDYWVVRDGGSFQITSISPGWDGTRNGTMVNPIPNQDQGFDSRVVWFGYDASRNIADDLPYTATGPASIVSCISVTATQSYQIDTVAVLTVLDEAPPAGAFRPPYAGSDKSIIATTSDLNYGRLQSLDSSSVSNIPSMSSVEANFERPWIDLRDAFYSAHLHPISNQPTYGREICRETGEAGLMLNLNFTNAEKETLLIRYVQLGIDIFGLAENGHVWAADGGHKQGRKLPLLIAGWVLDDDDILDWADAGQNHVFQEDLQTDYVDQALIDITNSGSWNPDTRNPNYSPYDSSDLGNPEWAIRLHANPELSDADWGAYYREVNGGVSTTTSLVVYLMGLKSVWNWPAFFDYYEDRYWPAENGTAGSGTNSITSFTYSVWQQYGP